MIVSFYWRQLLPVLFLICFEHVKTDTNPDEIKDLPGVVSKLNFRQYSGYLNGTDGKFLHYWFVESQKDPANDPLVLWLNGGPGCSSMEGFLSELGPLHVKSDGKTLYNNPYSWNLIANIIFLESPAGVGYSYTTDKQYVPTDDDTSLNNYKALLSFFEKYPQFKKNDFYITGESYGGIYVPTLSIRVLDNENINFKGFAIGNGFLNEKINSNSLIYFLYNHGVVDDNLWVKLINYCCDGHLDPKSCDFTVETEPCATLVTQTSKLMADLNVYNLYADCFHPSSLKSKISRINIDYQNLMRPFPFHSELTTPNCVDDTNMTTWLNLKSVREALHIPKFLPKWEICSDYVSEHYKRTYKTMKPQVLKLLNSGKLRGLIYNGDVDMACNFLGDEWFVDDLQLESATNYKPWKFGEQIGGFVKTYRNLTFTTIRGSGHMVPQDKPGPAFKMISSFLFNKPF